MFQIEVADFTLCGYKRNYCLQQITVCDRHACTHNTPYCLYFEFAISRWETVCICQVNLSIFDIKQPLPCSRNQWLQSNEITLQPL